MIKINKPQIKDENDKAILTCIIEIDDNKEELFYEIDKKYKKYLCTERSDAFVVAALYYAMKHNHDIEADFPITSELYHNLTTYLIPTLSKHSDHLSKININIPTISEPIKTKGEVGTGMSCGIDSMHVLKNYLNPQDESMKITCLCLNNVGSFKAYAEKYRGKGSEKVRNDVIKRAEKIAKETNLPLIVTNSNVYKIFNDVYFRVHTFANMFSVLLMQKFFGKYYYASSGYDLTYYNIIDDYKLDSAEYDILTFYALSTNTLKIYPEGNENTRLEKTIAIADFKYAKEYLHVCIKDSNNCGKCLKCRRTMLALDAIGKLDNFKKVFDVEYYRNNKEEYLKWLEKEVDEEQIMNVATSKLLDQKEGHTQYQDIEEYNNKNIILPELDIASISIKRDDFILNKNADKNYHTNLAYILRVSLELTKYENKRIRVPKYILDNVKVYYKNQKTIKAKLKYLYRIIRKRTRKINLYDLIYFLILKPSTTNNILKFLRKEKYLKGIKKSDFSSAKDLVDIFEKVEKNDYLKEVLNTEQITIAGKVLKTQNFIKTCKDRYYMYNKYDLSIVTKDKENYYFIGKAGKYTIAIISKYNKKDKLKAFDEICQGYGLVKKLIEKS